MHTIGFNKAVFGVCLLAGFCLAYPSPAHAWWDEGRSRHEYPHYREYPYGRLSVELPKGFISVGFGGVSYFYSSGTFYQEHERRYIVVPPPAGVVVAGIPDGYHQVVIDGVLYYTYNGVYYTRMPRGYQVIEPPATVVVGPTTVVSNVAVNNPREEFTVNIPNTQGGYTSVVIKPSGSGFVGPQGEFYAEFPKVSQLKVMYGK
ncbi:MAG: hypothetical protein HQL19_03300 [Candidatus Omnitrophica bacterium]|nr:hypothetical protein [Candidatus Omnitrophota bacterium]